MIFLGIVLLVGGMAVSIGAPSEARDARVLAERGIDTTATVTDFSVRSGGSRGSPYAVVDLVFEDEYTLPHESSGIIYCGEPEAISVGKEVRITYDPEEVASPQFAECEQSQEITIPLVIGIVVIVAGTLSVIWGWRARRWKRRWLGIPILILGLLFGGTSFEDECRCPEMVYTGAALFVIGIVPLVAPRRAVAVGTSSSLEASSDER